MRRGRAIRATTGGEEEAGPMQEQRSKRLSRQIAAIVLLILMDMVFSFVGFPLIHGAP